MSWPSGVMDGNRGNMLASTESRGCDEGMPGAGLGPVEMGTTVGVETESNGPGVGVILVETAVRGLGTGSGSNSRLLELDIVDSDVREGIEG